MLGEAKERKTQPKCEANFFDCNFVLNRLQIGKLIL